MEIIRNVSANAEFTPKDPELLCKLILKRAAQ